MTEDVITPAKERIDAFRDVQKMFHDHWIITERSRLPIQNIMEPVPSEDPKKAYTMKTNPIKKGIEGVALTILGSIMVLFIGFFYFFLFIGACLLLAFRVLLDVSKKLLPLAILILLGVVAYKLWYL